jgi:hypothetical protein
MPEAGRGKHRFHRDHRRAGQLVAGKLWSGRHARGAAATATPDKVRPLAPQQIIEIACADFETPTDKLTAAEQSPPPKTLPGMAQGRFIMVNGRIESQRPPATEERA